VLLTVVVTAVSVALLGWALFLVAVARARPDGGVDGGMARIVPDMLRLLRDLARDPTLPRSIRWRLAIAVLYNAQPLNLIPDFIPVLGLVDNIVVTAWALRAAMTAAGPEAVARHWKGTPDGLAVLRRVIRLRAAEAPADSGVALP